MSDSLLWERGMSQLQIIMFPGLIFKLVVEIYKTFPASGWSVITDKEEAHTPWPTLSAFLRRLDGHALGT